jgi:uncharacterized protein YyaL (SSP411 family)
MITGFARAGMGLRGPETADYIKCAIKAMDFLKKYVIKEETYDLLRSCYRDEKDETKVVNLAKPIYGCVDDFANLIAASLDLFHATFEPKYLEQAVKVRT